MSTVQFGIGTLKARINGLGSGCAVTTGASGAPTHGFAVAGGRVWLDGINIEVSGTSVLFTETGATGSGLRLYAYLPSASDGDTGGLAVSTAAQKLTGTSVAILQDFSYGTGASASTHSGVSALTALEAFGRVINGSLTITYDQAMARGGTLLFPTDLKHFNGEVAVHAEYAEVSGAALNKIFGGSYASGAANSGTWTVSSTNKPLPFMIEFQQTTDGNTAIYRVVKCFSNNLTLNYSREDYMIPAFDAIGIGNVRGTVLTITQ